MKPPYIIIFPIILIFACVPIDEDGNPITSTYPSLDTQDSIIQVLKKIENNLDFISITPTIDVFFQPEVGFEPKESLEETVFKIKSKAYDIFYFDLYKYRLSPAYFYNSQNGIHDLGDTMMKGYRNQLPDLFKENASLNINSKSGISVDINLNVSEKVLSEVLYAIKTFSGIESLKLEILLRGFADGQQGEWKRPIESAPYNYQYITYYPVLEKYRNRDFYFQYQDIMKKRLIRGYYNNSDLAFLRAWYIKDEIFDRLLELHDLDHVKVSLLEGRDYKKYPNTDKLRIVEVFFRFR